MKMQRILCPVDFSERSRQAVEYARGFAETFKSEIHLLHVMEPIIYPIEYGVAPTPHLDLEETARANAEAELRKLAETAARGVKTQIWVRIGRAAEAIVDVAKDASVDLVVMATHGRTGVSHLFLGSTAERVVRLAPCPVLAAKWAERDASAHA
jgi:nucleotide-binding universal stress UspA family protein